LHTRNHLIKKIGRVRHRRISIEEPTGTFYTEREKSAFAVLYRIIVRYKTND
jgi:hypothetical protein